MRLLFVADGRSPIALNWMRYFVERGDEVHLASTFPCAPSLRLASLCFTPAAFSSLKAGQPGAAAGGQPAKTAGWGAGAVGLRTALRRWIGPLTLGRAALRLTQEIERVRPDLVHAMRIPYEGMLASRALDKQVGIPLLVSIWGNDFTLHAPATPLMAAETRRTLRCASALHADCRRDLRLAHDWGFPIDRPAVVLPGAGGIQLDLFSPPDEAAQGAGSSGRSEPPLILNPRGFRAYVRNDTFFKSIPLVLEAYPVARFACPGMYGERLAKRWLDELGIGGNVELLPAQSRPQMAEWFRRAWVAVSPSTHDGTPNTLLEAMACGCFPVAGDIESLREWIRPGENGLLVDPGNPLALAQAVCLALDRPELRATAAEMNRRLVAERAEYNKVMQQAARFYSDIT